MDQSLFSELFEKVKNQPQRRLVVANGVDIHSLEAVARAISKNLVTVIITGDASLIHEECRRLGIPSDKYEVRDCSDEKEAAAMAVDLARSGEADLIMKGLLNTDVFMKAILNKTSGIMSHDALLAHMSMMKSRNYHKPLFFSDVAIIPLPTLDQKTVITRYLIDVARCFGIDRPKVAFIAASEKVIEKMPACSDAYTLKLKWEAGWFGSSFCDGPMGIDLAIDKEAALIKNYTSQVAGDADCLLFPNIEAGNVFYKTNAKWCKSEMAAIVMGTKVPVVLSSRGDSVDTKLNSIALAALMGSTNATKD